MKKLIRYLSKISGVEEEIKVETCKQIGQSMLDYSYWFNLPIGYDASNTLYLYSEHLRNGHSHLYGSQFSSMRTEYYTLHKSGKWIHNNKEN